MTEIIHVIKSCLFLWSCKVSVKEILFGWCGWFLLFWFTETIFFQCYKTSYEDFVKSIVSIVVDDAVIQ